MEVFFIGTGGGRVNLVRQLRGTGGFRINGSLNFHVDPGPGALFNSLKYKQNPEKIDVLVVTHAHIDHCNDAQLMIEAMTEFMNMKKGILVGSRNVLEGGKRYDRVVSRYHQQGVKELHVMEQGKEIELEVGGKKARMQGVEARHDERSVFGFKLWMDGKVIGHTSDTEYFDGLGELYRGCDLLVVNNLKPTDDGIPDHLKTEDTIEILKEARPKKAVITHLGMKLIMMPPELEAEKISRESGVETVAARDGMKYEFGKERGEKKLADF